MRTRNILRLKKGKRNEIVSLNVLGRNKRFDSSFHSNFDFKQKCDRIGREVYCLELNISTEEISSQRENLEKENICLRSFAENSRWPMCSRSQVCFFCQASQNVYL